MPAGGEIPDTEKLNKFGGSATLNQSREARRCQSEDEDCQK
jgi:hypothetical protein